MIDFVGMVKEFHGKYKHPIDGPMTKESLDFRYSLINEEFAEIYEEIYDDYFDVLSPKQVDKAKLTKELADLMYVTIGFAISHGFPIEEVFKRVHESNMTKTGDKRGDGKVLKGPDYVPVTFEGLFDE